MEKTILIITISTLINGDQKEKLWFVPWLPSFLCKKVFVSLIQVASIMKADVLMFPSVFDS